MSESTGSFNSFLGSVGIKGSSKKLKKSPASNKTIDDKASGDPEAIAKAQKEHRRAQVRKAQFEHRQRKKNLVKFLEEDVKRLRESITAAEAERTALDQENAAINSTLLSAHITPPPRVSISSQLSPPKALSPLDFSNTSPSNATSLSPQSDSRSPTSTIRRHSSTSTNLTVSRHFDNSLGKDCLHVRPSNEGQLSISTKFPAISGVANEMSATSALESALTSTTLDTLPQQSQSAVSFPGMPPQPDIPSIAINFILALEHPCRTHCFQSYATAFDPEGRPSGHELMASTLLYAHAPASVFTDLDNAAWPVPPLELSTLWEMSQSLPKGDFEITPVQAWFMLTATYDIKTLLGDGGQKLERIKSGLAEVVNCFVFGTLMPEGCFWQIVWGVMGENQSGEGVV